MLSEQMKLYREMKGERNVRQNQKICNCVFKDIQLSEVSIRPFFSILKYPFQVPTPYSTLEMEVDADVVMTVTQIDAPDRLYLQLDEQESSAPCAKYRNQLLQDLENLSFKLQEDAPQYPKLKVVRPGQFFQKTFLVFKIICF